MQISARQLHFQTLNEKIRTAAERHIFIEHCCGQRFIASGLSEKEITLHGTPGNALGAYLNGAAINVYGNVQDAVGDTMNDGEIIVHGNAGDALGYAMRGGNIFVHGNAGYRTGIHMKEYQDKKPVIIVGGGVGSFLGEYLAGGTIIVLGLASDTLPVGNFTGTGMHGGKIFIRTNQSLTDLQQQVSSSIASAAELAEISPYIEKFATYFAENANEILQDRFYILKPNAKNPYKRLYVAN
jgi:Glutamate synthase domain 3